MTNHKWKISTTKGSYVSINLHQSLLKFLKREVELIVIKYIMLKNETKFTKPFQSYQISRCINTE
ncbi:hypothetical protein MtrunA17_Chr7g0248901 [Medicago truncatula]|uniref:Uncharacterized protein n=1 Tax=Medicago truncatula TaxID=3880 RepID=A0A396H2Y4_MEDTR|nr:hypothetical protein MtrunA17_Chr7g0248901 [Medicago truncatula]